LGHYLRFGTFLKDSAAFKKEENHAKWIACTSWDSYLLLAEYTLSDLKLVCYF
jgi:hypothetical protein